VPTGFEVVLQEQTRGLADLVLRALALGQEEGEVIVEVWNRRALL
jgi:hypothetical protein